MVERLGERFSTVPPGPWSDPPHRAVVLSIPSNKPREPAGLMVAGVSARLQWNQHYGDFFELIRTQIAAAIANAKAYEEKRRRAEALAEIDRVKTAFFSNVSHEFRTPLTLILGPVEDLLARSHTDLAPAVAVQLDIVNRNGRRLLRLVNTLLDFSRIEASRMEAFYQPTDLAAFTADLASNFRSACERAGLRLTVACPPLDEPVCVDRALWEKIVLNLLSNAFKFTFEGEIAVTLRPAGRAVELRVRDTGTGIPAEEMPRLFERFHRIQNARGRTNEGSGIGLALVQELVKLHGGTITAESALGQGTTFTIIVPLGSAHLPPEQVGQGRALASTALGAGPYVEEALRWLPDEERNEDGRSELPAFYEPLPVPHLAPRQQENDDRPRVLLADDNADMRHYVRHLLAEHYRIEAVPDGEAALTAARERLPDLVLTDVMMPRLDGFGLLRELRADPRTRGLPILLLSARAGEESRIEGMKAGADDYLVKPFSARELLARVSAHLQMARLRRQADEALRQSHARFEALLNAAPIGVCLVDPDLRIRQVNPRARPSFGDIEGLIGRDFAEITHLLWPKAYADEIVERFRHTLETGEPYFVPERIEERRDRQVLEYYEWEIHRISLPDNRYGVVCYFNDISRHVLARQALAEADRRKNEFLATLAHELRNPLAPIRTGLQVMKLARDDAETVEQSRAMMERQLGQMVRLIDDLLDVSRISHGKIELRKERVQLAALVHSAIEASRPLLEEMGHQLAVALPAQPIVVDADPVRLTQVLLNLLNNAAKYTERGGRIWLTAERQGSDAVIAVRDSGIGIRADQLPRVFEMFSQVDRSMERSRGGLGIGLTLARRLIEMHGGGIEARSEGPGKGSEFLVRLPVAVEASRPRMADEENEAAAPSSLRILIVDDNRDSADSLAMMLRIMGHDLRTAYDGQQGVDTAEAFRPDVVLLDIGLPKLNGYEACQRIREQAWSKDTVLIAVTGWGQDEDRRRSREAGFDYHAVKPVDPQALVKMLAEPRGVQT